MIARTEEAGVLVAFCRCGTAMQREKKRVRIMLGLLLRNAARPAQGA